MKTKVLIENHKIDNPCIKLSNKKNWIIRCNVLAVKNWNELINNLHIPDNYRAKAIEEGAWVQKKLIDKEQKAKAEREAREQRIAEREAGQKKIQLLQHQANNIPDTVERFLFQKNKGLAIDVRKSGLNFINKIQLIKDRKTYGIRTIKEVKALEPHLITTKYNGRYTITVHLYAVELLKLEKVTVI